MIHILNALLFCAFASQASAATSEAGAILLREPFGARPFTMGQAYAAVGDDIFGMAYNAASLSRLKESQVATQFIQSMVDTQLGFVGVASPLNPTQAMGLSIGYLDAGKFDVFDDNGNQTNTVNAQRDFLVQLGYAHAFDLSHGRLHLGASGKALRSVLLDQGRAMTYAGDLGGIFEVPWNNGLVSAGAAVSNWGPAIKYTGGVAGGSASDPLPLTTRLALGYNKNIFTSDALAAGFEVDRVFYENRLFEGFGVEYNYHSLFALRLGYRAGQDLGGLTMGIGLSLKSLSIDYGIGLMQTFNNVQQVSLRYHFTISGIRYSSERGTSLESLMSGVRSEIAANRYFEAADWTEKIQTLFPDAPEISQVKEQLDRTISTLLLQGPGSARYNYALGYRMYHEANWEAAVSNLEASTRFDPANREVRAYLAKARQNRDAGRQQLKLQQQATLGTLFELADKAYQSGDLSRAQRIIGEILKVAPYEPALSLQSRIEKDMSRPAPKPIPAAKAVPSTAPSRPQPSAEDIQKAEDLYWEAVRNYKENNINKAIANIQEGLRLNPDNENLRSTLDIIQKESRKTH